MFTQLNIFFTEDLKVKENKHVWPNTSSYKTENLMYVVVILEWFPPLVKIRKIILT